MQPPFSQGRKGVGPSHPSTGWRTPRSRTAPLFETVCENRVFEAMRNASRLLSRRTPLAIGTPSLPVRYTRARPAVRPSTHVAVGPARLPAGQATGRSIREVAGAGISVETGDPKALHHRQVSREQRVNNRGLPMIPSPYGEAALKQHFRVGDSARWKVDVTTDGERIAASARTYALMSPPNVSILSKVNSSGKRIYFSANIETDLIMRATYRRLLRQYTVIPPNRREIINGIIEATSEATPYKVTKCDIRSFYERLDAEHIVNFILCDTRTSPEIKSVLRQIYNVIQQPKSFVPRGLAISTFLAEMALKDFDQSIKKERGVHRYFRFADDIIVFTTPKSQIIDLIESRLSELGLETNEKTEIVNIRSIKGGSAQTEDADKRYEYLGYCFLPTEVVERLETRRFSIRIANSKVKKRMTRAFRAMYAFKKDRDGQLLIDRLNYLSANRSVFKKKHTHGARKQKIGTGIHYSYPSCGHYPASKRGRIYQAHGSPELVKLDAAIKAALFARNGEFSTYIAALPTDQRNRLASISFAQGYRRRLMKRFSRDRVKKICEAWGNE